MRTLKDRYGFLFWLKWILLFAGSFIVAAGFWTVVMRLLFGKVQGEELTITWAIAVFGSWFLLVIPFMRKKEQIWKRLNEDEEKAVSAWFKGTGYFIGLLIAGSLIWSFVLREEILTPGFQAVWAKAVFASWLALLIPFSVWMVRRADQIFKNALERQTYVPRYKHIPVERSERLLPERFSAKLRAVDPVLKNSHIVTVILKNRRRIPHVFVLNSNEILGVYDRPELGFRSADIHDIEITPKETLPAFDESKWLRIDLYL